MQNTGLSAMKNEMMVKKVSIHQSQYIPWGPYFKKIAATDVFVIMDNVQYQIRGVQNRNKIRNVTGDFWLTIPVTGHQSDIIRDKLISDHSWKAKHWKALELSYAKAPYWNLYKNDLMKLYKVDYHTIWDANQAFFHYIMSVLEIKTKVMVLSDLNLATAKSDLILDICKAVGADCYLSGTGSKNYLVEESFIDEGISIVYKESIPPEYKQFHGSFIPGLSVLDMLFNMTKADLLLYIHEE